MNKASDRELMILSQIPGASVRKIQRELKRRNKENYGYELAKMFGVSPPPSNKPSMAHANVFGRFIPSKMRSQLYPGLAQYIRPQSAPKPMNPMKAMAKRGSYRNIWLDRNPKSYKHTWWRFVSRPLAHATNHELFYESRNSDPFLINKRTGRRRRAPMRLLQGGVANLEARNNRVHTWDAYLKRANQARKQVELLRKANNYATGRSPSIKLTPGQMKYYFREHPRALNLNAHTVNDIRKGILNKLKNNMYTYIQPPERAHNNWNRLMDAKNMNTLVRNMKAFKEKNYLTDWNKQKFDIYLRRATTRNKTGVYFA